jgi:hypothetical protein
VVDLGLIVEVALGLAEVTREAIAEVLLEGSRGLFMQRHRAPKGCVLSSFRLFGPLDPPTQIHEPILDIAQGSL